MKVFYHKKFEKHFKKLSFKLQDDVLRVIELFKTDPFSASLKNHPLKGPMRGRRAISITGDVRIIFEEHDNYVVVVMLDIGSHNQVY